MSKRTEKSFEEQMTRLEVIVGKLEDRETPLEEALTLFQEGLELSNALKDKLRTVEDRIRVLIEQADGTLTTRPAPELEMD